MAFCPWLADAGWIYLCKSYSVGTFWASSHCNQYSALMEEIVSVPDAMPFDQQVNLAQQQNVSQSTSRTINTLTATSPSTSGRSESEVCKALDIQITWHDALARQPQSGQTKDSISEKKARNRQFAIRS